MKSEYIIELKEGVGRNPETRLQAPATFCLASREQVAVVGENGAGKSLLIDLITGKTPLNSGSLAYHFGADRPKEAYLNLYQITFEDVIGTVENPYYLQQRFNAQDRDASPFLKDVLHLSSEETSLKDQHMAQVFNIPALYDKRMVTLSSGEMRRYQLFKALLTHPRVLIVDNPFIGLDESMRNELHDFFRRLIAEDEVQIVMVLSSLTGIPSYMTHVVTVHQGVVGPKQAYADYHPETLDIHKQLLSPEQIDQIIQLPTKPVVTLSSDHQIGDEVIRLQNLTIQIGQRTFFNGLNWVIRRGERWALQGANGVGKSTLLSLICADNPMAYAIDIAIYGCKRGTGESIWDVKKPIGFVSPELHRAYHEDIPTLEIVASGLHDSVGLFQHSRPEQRDICIFWMDIFGISHLADRSFLTLSSGEQRLALLARVFVKDPSLIILDEPLHGLDTYYRERVRQIIATFCRRPDKTLIMVTHYPQFLPEGMTHSLTL